MASEARLKGKLTMDDSQFSAVLRKASAAAAAFASKFGATIAKVGAVGFAALAAGAIAAAGALAFGVKGALDLGGALVDLAAKTGAGTGALAIINQAMENAGLTSEDTGKGITKLQKAIASAASGSKEARKSFSDIGVSLEDIRNLSPDQQFVKVGQAIAAIQDPAERTAAAMAIFGKSGASLNQLFADPKAFEQAAKTLGSAAGILNRQAGQFDMASDLLGNVGKKFQGFFVGVADKIVGGIIPVLQAINDFDFAVVGQKVGDALVAATELFKSGMITAASFLTGAFQDPSAFLGVIWSYLKAEFFDFLSVMNKGLVWAVQSIWTFAQSTFPKLADWIVAKLVAIGPVIGKFLVSAAVEMVSTIYIGFKQIVSFLNAGIGTAVDALLEAVGAIDQFNVTGLKGYQGKGFQGNYKDQMANLSGNPLDKFVMDQKAKAESDLNEAFKGVSGAGSEIMDKVMSFVQKFGEGTAFDDQAAAARAELIDSVAKLTAAGKPVVEAAITKATAAVQSIAQAAQTAAPAAAKAGFKAGPLGWSPGLGSPNYLRPLGKPGEDTGGMMLGGPTRLTNGYRQKGESADEFRARRQKERDEKRGKKRGKEPQEEQVDLLKTLVNQTSIAWSVPG